MPDVKHVLVAVNGGRTDDEAVRTACATARKQRARLTAVYVIEVTRDLPLDAAMESAVERGEGALERAEEIATQNDVAIDTQILQARDVAPAIVDEAVERRCDLIVLGLPYNRRRFGEFTLGHTASYVLKNAPSWVWIVREPIHTAELAARR